MTTMTKITSSNRAAARKLLTTWHDSRKVRVMRLSGLHDALYRAINEGLITVEGVNRALGKKSEQKNDHDDDGHGEQQDNGGQNDESTGDNSGSGNDSQSEGGEEQSSGDSRSERERSADYQEGYEDAKAGKPRSSKMRKTPESALDYNNGYDAGQKAKDGEQESESEQEQEDEQSNCETCGADAEAQQYARDNESTRPACDDCGAYAETDDNGMLYPREFDTVIRWIKAGVPVALVGPTGSGKSVLSAMVGDALKLDNYGCGAMLSKYDLIGFVDAGGTYHGTPLYDAVMRGGLFTFDEMDASAPDATVAFNAVADAQKQVTFPCGVVAKHEALRIIACMNTWGNGATADYVGRNKQDASATDRYAFVYIDYDERVELKIADADIVKRAQKLRAACTALGIRHIVSTRNIALSQKGRDAGQSNAIIDRCLLFKGLDDDTVKQLKTAMEAN